MDHLSGIVVSISDCHPRGTGFDSRLYRINFSGGIGSETGSTQPREHNWQLKLTDMPSGVVKLS